MHGHGVSAGEESWLALQPDLCHVPPAAGVGVSCPITMPHHRPAQVQHRLAR